MDRRSSTSTAIRNEPWWSAAFGTVSYGASAMIWRLGSLRPAGFGTRRWRIAAVSGALSGALADRAAGHSLVWCTAGTAALVLMLWIALPRIYRDDGRFAYQLACVATLTNLLCVAAPAVTWLWWTWMALAVAPRWRDAARELLS